MTVRIFPSHPYQAWMPPMSRRAPIGLWDSSQHLSWLYGTLAAERFAGDPAFRERIRALHATWGDHGLRDQWRELWTEVLAADPEEGARLIAEPSRDGETRRDALKHIGWDYYQLDPGDRDRLLALLVIQAEDGLVAYGVSPK